MEYLERLTERPSLEEVVHKMQGLEVSVEELGEYVQYSNKHYRRNLIFQNEYVQLLCLCWKSGQRSPIHDHAGSTCAVKIITGIASETVYEMTSSGLINLVHTFDYPEGVMGSEDSDIHQVSNLQGKGEDLVTLHCYSPPLKKMKTFSIDSRLVQDYEPID